MTAAGGTGRGRGRPAAGCGFTAEAQAALLAALAAGAKLAEAAAKAGVSRNVPAQHAKTNRAFAAALADAKARGRAVRAETMPHGEARYNHAKCRCTVCRAKATAARTARRAAAADTAQEETAKPIPLPTATGESPHSFLLARAS